VSELAIRCFGLLARGLQAKFVPIGRKAVPTLFERFKEKKAVIVTALHEALSRMHPYCFTIQDLLEEAQTLSKHKVPQVKEHLLKFLYNISLLSPKPLLRKCTSPLCSIYSTVRLLIFCCLQNQLMDDGNPGVRDAAFQGFAGLIVCLGKQAVNDVFQKLDKHKQKKIEESTSNVAVPTPEVKTVTTTTTSRPAPPVPMSQRTEARREIPEGE
jgi:hypothetical protein